LFAATRGWLPGVIYSVCGDLHRSEDLAQETFLSAWKSLSGMNDPEKLAPWLCQIARRKAIDFQRSNLREKNRLSHLFPVLTAGESTSPPQEALANEERELLWRILTELPQRYRETMVLYYRQEQSTSAVALATGITEDAVRQRLTRGREMLRDQMAEILERNLVRSTPSPAFTVAVVAALPALTLPAAKAATLGAAAKGSTLLGGGGVMVWGAALLGPLVALWSGIFALRGELRASQSRHESRFLILFSGLVAICLAGLCALWATNLFASRLFQVRYFNGLGAILLPIGSAVVAVITIRMGRHQRYAIRARESWGGTAPIGDFASRRRKLPVGMAIVVVLSSVSWMFDFAWRARDFRGIALLSVLTIALTSVAVYCWSGGSAERSRWFSLLILPILGIITLSLMKWRLHEWIRVIYHQSHSHPMPWSVLISMAMFFVGGEVVVVELVGFGKRTRTHPSKIIPAQR
jgi:RNA polymerase sigma factor (sigma-70 family)